MEKTWPMGMNPAESIIVSAWWPVPNRRQELAAAVPIDTLALNELLEELERTFPEYEIVRAGHAMAGMHDPPDAGSSRCKSLGMIWRVLRQERRSRFCVR